MSPTTQMVIYGLVVPAVVAAVVAEGLRYSGSSFARRAELALPVGLAFAVGYLLLPAWAELWPARHWQWLPYLGALAALLGPLLQADGVTTGERWVTRWVLAGVAGWLLVPDWPDLQPARPYWVVGVTIYLGALMSVQAGSARERSTVEIGLGWGLVSVVLTVLVLVLVSAKYAQLGGLLVAALAGGGVIAGVPWGPKRPWATAIRGLLPLNGLLAGGLAFIAGIESQPPSWGLFFVPLTVLSLPLTQRGPLARHDGRRATILRILLMSGLLVALGLWLVNLD